MLLLILGVLGVSSWSAAQALGKNEQLESQLESFYIIAHTSVPSLSKNQLKALLSLQKQLLPNNKRAVLAVMVPTDPTANIVSQHFFNNFAYQLQRLWDREVFTGRAIAPNQFESTEALLNFVSSTQNSIGYIDAKTFHADTPALAKSKGDVHVLLSVQ